MLIVVLNKKFNIFEFILINKNNFIQILIFNFNIVYHTNLVKNMYLLNIRSLWIRIAIVF